MGDGRGTCVRCGGKDKWIKARQLCESCYRQVTALGTRENYPTLRRRRLNPDCQCFTPIPERLPLYNATQCKRCGKRIS